MAEHTAWDSVRIREGGYSTDNMIKSMDDDELMRKMGIPERVARWVPSNPVEELPHEVKFWLAHLPHIFRPLTNENLEMYAKGLILYGPSGSKKTSSAASLLLHLIRLGIRNTDPTGANKSWHGWAMGRFVDWQDASEMFRQAAGGRDVLVEEAAANLRWAMKPGGPTMMESGDFLVIDDISRERATEFNSGELHRILRHRENWGYPTILTTNHPPGDWQEVYGDVLASFMNRAFIKVEF